MSNLYIKYSHPPGGSPYHTTSYQLGRVKANTCFLWDRWQTASFQTASPAVPWGGIMHLETSICPLTDVFLFHYRVRNNINMLLLHNCPPPLSC